MALDFPSSPTDGQTYTSNNITWEYSTSTTTWNLKEDGAVGKTRVAFIERREDSSVGDLGAFTQNVWAIRELNHKTDPQNMVSLDSGHEKFSLEAGTYRIKWGAPAVRCDRHQSKLVYATNSSFTSPTAVYGSSEIIEDGANLVGTRSLGETVLTLTTTTWFRIEQIIDGDQGNSSKGYNTAAIFSGVTNPPTYSIYTQVSVEDLATAVKESEIVNTGTTKVATVKDVKAYNENGGSFTADTWIHRNLNTLSDPQSIGLSISGNIVTVPAGTYSIRWRAPAYNCDRFTSRLHYSSQSDFSSDNNYIIGSSGYSHQNDSVTVAETFGDVASLTFTGNTYLKIEQYSLDGYTVGGTNSTGLGASSGKVGLDSIYTTVVIEDLATAVKNTGDDYVAGTSKVAVIEDQKTSGTAGGNFNNGVWRDRDLTTKTDPQSFVTLDSGNVYFSLPAGTYEIGWSAPATAVDNHQTRLIYATDTGFSAGVNYVYGSSEQSDQNEGPESGGAIVNETRSFGTTVLTTSVITYFKIQHRCATSSVGTNGNTQNWGRGKPNGFTSDGSHVEVYTQVSIEDLKTAVKESSGGDGIVNIADYGADASKTDGTNVDAINAAISALGTNGGTVYFPGGQFYLNAAITITRAANENSIRFVGTGQQNYGGNPTQDLSATPPNYGDVGGTVLRRDQDDEFFNITNSRAIHFIGITFKGGSASGSGGDSGISGGNGAIYVEADAGCQGYLIENCVFHGIKNCIHFKGLSDSIIRACRFRNVPTNEGTGALITLDENGGERGDQIRIADCVGDGSPDGSALNNQVDGIVLKNYINTVFITNTSMIRLNRSFYTDSSWEGEFLYFQNAESERASGTAGFVFDSAGTGGSGNFISIDNCFSSTHEGHGIQLSTSLDASVNITNCNVRDNKGHGILVDSNGGNTSIVNPICCGNSKDSSGSNHGISIGSGINDVYIAGGRCGGNSSLTGSGTQNYGIFVNGTTHSNIRIIGTNVTGNVQADGISMSISSGTGNKVSLNSGSSVSIDN